MRVISARRWPLWGRADSCYRRDGHLALIQEASMNLHTVLAICALIGSIVLLVHKARRLLTFIAVIASGLEVLMALGIVHFGVRGLPLGLILGGTLAVVGAILFTQLGSKNAVAAATVVTLV